jgi:hypothetical protein
MARVRISRSAVGLLTSVLDRRPNLLATRLSLSLSLISDQRPNLLATRLSLSLSLIRLSLATTAASGFIEPVAVVALVLIIVTILTLLSCTLMATFGPLSTTVTSLSIPLCSVSKLQVMLCYWPLTEPPSTPSSPSFGLFIVFAGVPALNSRVVATLVATTSARRANPRSTNMGAGVGVSRVKTSILFIGHGLSWRSCRLLCTACDFS